MTTTTDPPAAKLKVSDMLLILHMAGWEYSPETPETYARITKWHAETSLWEELRAGYNNDGLGCRSNATNVREIFKRFLARSNFE